MNCYLLGNNSLTIECADTLLRSEHRIEGIVTTDDAVAKWAESHGVPVLTHDLELCSRLAQKPFDLLLSIAGATLLRESKDCRQ